MTFAKDIHRLWFLFIVLELNFNRNSVCEWKDRVVSSATEGYTTEAGKHKNQCSVSTNVFRIADKPYVIFV